MSPLMNGYIAGELVSVSVTFTNNSVTPAVPADPAQVFFKWKTPSGVVTTWQYGVTGSIVKDSVGNYHADLDTTGQVGLWTYEWSCPNPQIGQSINSNIFQVVPAAI